MAVVATAFKLPEGATHEGVPVIVQAQHYDGMNESACSILYWLGLIAKPGPQRLGWVDSIGSLWVRADTKVGQTVRPVLPGHWILRQLQPPLPESYSGITVISNEDFERGYRSIHQSLTP